MDPPRVILHADLDAFFASVEQLDHPPLRGKPVLVGGRGKRGVVAAASYEARTFGCRSAMPMARALALCPAAIVARPRFDRYSQLSDLFMGILGRYSPLVEPLSVDEAFVDCTGSARLHGTGTQIGQAIRAAVRSELLLTASVGVGPNKFVAKLASDMRKPDGLVVAPDDGLSEWLASVPIERMWGVGPKTLPRYHAAGVRTFGDLQQLPEAQVLARLGEHALGARERAFGRDTRPVETGGERKGIGHEQTFGDDLEDPALVLDVLQDLAESACTRLRAAGGRTRRITVKIRFGDFETITRSTTLEHETDSTLEVWRAARTVFQRWASAGFVPVRLVGIRLERLAEGQFVPDLFTAPRQEKERTLDRVADAIEAKFGRGTIGRGDLGRITGRPRRKRERPGPPGNAPAAPE